MQKVPLGKTGMEVSRLGVGLAEIGNELSFGDAEQAGQVSTRGSTFSTLRPVTASRKS